MFQLKFDTISSSPLDSLGLAESLILSFTVVLYPLQGLKTEQILLESDDTLPFENNSQDLIISNLWLHWVNELPKLFREVSFSNFRTRAVTRAKTLCTW